MALFRKLAHPDWGIPILIGNVADYQLLDLVATRRYRLRRTPCPYRELRAFESGDADTYFGREAAVAELAIGRARVEQAMAAAKQAEINLDRTTIRAPIDGVIIDRRANLGQNVAAGISGLFLLARNLDSMRIRTSVNETDIGKISVGQPVTFTVDSHRDRQLTGRVEKILLNAKLQGNFVTYDVFVVIDGPGRAAVRAAPDALVRQVIDRCCAK